MKQSVRIAEIRAQRDIDLPGWQLGPTLEPGDEALTDRWGKLRRVLVVNKKLFMKCESRVLLEVARHGELSDGEWYDSHWFAPVKEEIK